MDRRYLFFRRSRAAHSSRPTGQTPLSGGGEGEESNAGTNARGEARAANFRPEETREKIGGRADRAAKKGGKGGEKAFDAAWNNEGEEIRVYTGDRRRQRAERVEMGWRKEDEWKSGDDEVRGKRRDASASVARVIITDFPDLILRTVTRHNSLTQIAHERM